MKHLESEVDDMIAVLAGLSSAGIVYSLSKNPLYAAGMGIGSFLFVAAME